MLNENVMKLFDIIAVGLRTEEYVVIKKTEVFTKLDIDMTVAEFDDAITTLQNNELIKVLYLDGEKICIEILAKGILTREKRDDEKQKEIERQIAEAQRQKEEFERQLAISINSRPINDENEHIASDEPADTPTSTQEYIAEEDTKKEKFVERVNDSEINKKLALICGGSAFVGALLGGLITLIAVLIKLR